MKVRVQRNVGDAAHNKTATGMMERMAKNVRRRPSATFSDKASPEDQINDEEFTELLRDQDGDSADISRDSDENRNKRGGQPRDLSKWLRPCGIALGILVLITIAFSSINTLTRTSSLHVDIINFLRTGEGRIGNPQHKTGIELHPTNHVFRRPKTITHHWIVTSGLRSPDGVKKKVYLVNGEFPGPTIQCRSGDKLVIHVTNSLESECVSIHWHGLYMRSANSMDGVPGFTQCSIPVNGEFTYEFDIDKEQSGTFWWHAHSHVQRGDGMYGGLVVHRPAASQSDMDIYGYKKEMLLLIGDWYHQSAGEVLDWYTSVKGFGNEPVPDSLLINGAGKFECSMAVPARPVECIDVDEPVIGLPAKGATRVRIVNTGSLAGFTLRTESGSFTPIAVDGGQLISGRSAESVGILYPGERVDVISKFIIDSPSKSPRLHVSLDPENFKYSNRALQPNQTFPVFSTSTHNSTLDEDISSNGPNVPAAHFDLAFATSLSTNDSISPMNLDATAQQTILLYTKTQKLAINSNHPTGFINRTTWSPQSKPLISLPRSSWDMNQLIPFIPSKAEPIWVDIILNNLDDGSHPFHLHGHNFYVLSSFRSEHGWGSYSPFANPGTASSIAPTLNLVNPVMKDTVAVPRRGYVIIRFLASNPGIWMFHCHVLFHQGSGMAMGVHVGGDEGHGDVDPSSRALCAIDSQIDD